MKSRGHGTSAIFLISHADTNELFQFKDQPKEDSLPRPLRGFYSSDLNEREENELSERQWGFVTRMAKILVSDYGKLYILKFCFLYI